MRSRSGMQHVLATKTAIHTARIHSRCFELRDHHWTHTVSHALPSPLLVLEASTVAASVALLAGDGNVSSRTVWMGPGRNDAMLPSIAELLHETGLRVGDVRHIACGSGPGSFTGLRIAASLAKGLAVANDAALYAIPSLLLSVAELEGNAGRYVMHSDALRGDRYVLTARITVDGNIESSGETTRMRTSEVLQLGVAQGARVVAVGGGVNDGHAGNAAAASPPKTSSGADALDASKEQTSHAEMPLTVAPPHARNIMSLISMWSTFGPVSVAAWEPAYGRLAEAQVKWESAHGYPLPVSA